MKMFKSCVFVLFIVLTVPTHMCAVVQPNTVVATINTGITPAGIAITPDNAFAYVANNNNYGLTDQDSVSVLNVSTNLPETTIHDPSFNQPYTVTINAAGTTAYVTNSVDRTVTIIDIATNTVTGTITGFDGPSGFAITPDGDFAYVNNYGGPIAGSGNGTTVDVVDLNTNMIVGSPIVVDQAPAALAITPSGAYVYVINYVTGGPGTGTVSVIDTTTNLVVATITDASLFGPFSIAITPDGAYAYITNFGSNSFEPFGTTVTVIEIATNTVFAVINLNTIQPAGLAITPDGRFAYVSNYNTLYAGAGSTELTPGQGTVNIIDIATNQVLPPTIDVGQSPDAIAIAPNGTFAYVTNFISNTVSVIALQSFLLTGEGCKIRNIFLTQQEIVNKLTWSASGTSLPVTYVIYRNAQLTDIVATVPATDTLVFFDHNVAQDATDTYYLVGINDVGTASDPLEIVVTQYC